MAGNLLCSQSRVILEVLTTYVSGPALPAALHLTHSPAPLSNSWLRVKREVAKAEDQVFTELWPLISDLWP